MILVITKILRITFFVGLFSLPFTAATGIWLPGVEYVIKTIKELPEIAYTTALFIFVSYALIIMGSHAYINVYDQVKKGESIISACKASWKLNVKNTPVMELLFIVWIIVFYFLVLFRAYH